MRSDVRKYIENCIFMVKWDILLYKKYGEVSLLEDADKFILLAEKALDNNILPGIPNSIRWDNIQKMNWLLPYMRVK